MEAQLASCFFFSILFLTVKSSDKTNKINYTYTQSYNVNKTAESSLKKENAIQIENKRYTVLLKC